ncbi:hypothetical protein E7W39_21745 [Cronobacter sakazakii]|nr:hypothetical protein FZI10_17475 [Cronobacter sakazakii]KAB0866566.1 hypothetical protein FZH98_11365 [Cronobacter sakazakii]KAB1060437.1 hypothetical protein AUN10_10500 [Cronobacter sakazakii]KAB1484015.1 hypothetical protein FZI22_17110 [Cronobacter sakazakii]MCI0196492.1 hypothetical protein [Cronobacter sakazakii]
MLPINPQKKKKICKKVTPRTLSSVAGRGIIIRPFRAVYDPGGEKIKKFCVLPLDGGQADPIL